MVVRGGGGEQPFLAGPNYEKTFQRDEKPKRLRTADLEHWFTVLG